jgi:hypothetical protein
VVVEIEKWDFGEIWAGQLAWVGCSLVLYVILYRPTEAEEREVEQKTIWAERMSDLMRDLGIKNVVPAARYSKASQRTLRPHDF